MFETALPEEFNFDLDLSNEIQDSTPPTLNTKPTDYEFESQNIFCYSTCGKRQKNFDQIDFVQEENFILCALFDGHGDQTVSVFLKQNLLKKIKTHPHFGYNPIQTILKCLNQMENEIISNPIFDNSGSTAVVVLIYKENVVVVNIGDSVVFGTRKNGNCEVTLSSIHNLQIEKEREDVIGRRGLILKTGGTYRVHGNLSLSRSIGDKNYKEFISSTPEVNIYENSFEKIILTSDGIFTGRSRKNIQELKTDLINKQLFKDNATILEITNPF